MHGIKIPQQDFALKMQVGGLCTRGGIFVGHYSNILSSICFISTEDSLRLSGTGKNYCYT